MEGDLPPEIASVETEVVQEVSNQIDESTDNEMEEEAAEVEAEAATVDYSCSGAGTFPSPTLCRDYFTCTDDGTVGLHKLLSHGGWHGRPPQTLITWRMAR